MGPNPYNAPSYQAYESNPAPFPLHLHSLQSMDPSIDSTVVASGYNWDPQDENTQAQLYTDAVSNGYIAPKGQFHPQPNLKASDGSQYWRPTERRALQSLPVNAYSDRSGPGPNASSILPAEMDMSVASKPFQLSTPMLFQDHNWPLPGFFTSSGIGTSELPNISFGSESALSSPDGLHFNELTLKSPTTRSTPSLLKNSELEKKARRDGCRILPSASFEEVFEDLEPADVVVAFAHGTQMARIDKDLICSYSGFFAKAFDGPFRESHTRYIRLRNDFPYAIKAMITFMVSDFYSFEPDMVAEYPYITLLDLHVHAYVVSDKYEVPALRDYAIDQYLKIASEFLALDFGSDIPGLYNGSMGPIDDLDDMDDFTPSRPLEMPHHPADQSPSAEINRFLDSVVLLWKNTGGSYDPMRKAVLDLIKPCLTKLIKLRFFRTLLEYFEEFAQDLREALMEDGFDVDVKPSERNERYRMVMARGGGWGTEEWKMKRTGGVSLEGRKAIVVG